MGMTWKSIKCNQLTTQNKMGHLIEVIIKYMTGPHRGMTFFGMINTGDSIWSFEYETYFADQFSGEGDVFSDFQRGGQRFWAICNKNPWRNIKNHDSLSFFDVEVQIFLQRHCSLQANHERGATWTADFLWSTVTVVLRPTWSYQDS